MERVAMRQLHLAAQQRFRLRQQLHNTHDPAVLRRTLALLHLYAGRSFTAIASAFGVDRLSLCRARPAASAADGVRLEATSLRVAPWPAACPEEQTQSQAGQGVGTTDGPAVRGRSGPAAGSAVACWLGQTR